MKDNKIVGSRFRYINSRSNSSKFNRKIVSTAPSDITIKKARNGIPFSVCSDNGVIYQHYEIEIDFLHIRRKKSLMKLGIINK